MFQSVSLLFAFKYVRYHVLKCTHLQLLCVEWKISIFIIFYNAFYFSYFLSLSNYLIFIIFSFLDEQGSLGCNLGFKEACK